MYRGIFPFSSEFEFRRGCFCRGALKYGGTFLGPTYRKPAARGHHPIRISYGDPRFEFSYFKTVPFFVFRPSVQSSDLLNPLKFALSRVMLKRSGQDPLGFGVATAGSGVLKVVDVAQCGPAEKAGVANGEYLLAIDGKRISGEAHFKEIEKAPNRHHFRMALARKRQSELDSATFPLPPSVQRQNNCEYLPLR